MEKWVHKQALDHSTSCLYAQVARSDLFVLSFFLLRLNVTKNLQAVSQSENVFTSRNVKATFVQHMVQLSTNLIGKTNRAQFQRRYKMSSRLLKIRQ